jgi:hypothetical protein
MGVRLFRTHRTTTSYGLPAADAVTVSAAANIDMSSRTIRASAYAGMDTSVAPRMRARVIRISTSPDICRWMTSPWTSASPAAALIWNASDGMRPSRSTTMSTRDVSPMVPEALAVHSVAVSPVSRQPPSGSGSMDAVTSRAA